MTIELAVLNVGNGDSIIVLPDTGEAIVVDMPLPMSVREFLTGRDRSTIDCIYITHVHSDHVAPLPTVVNFIMDWLAIGTVSCLYLPIDYTDRARAATRDKNQNALVRDALAKLRIWEKGQGSISKPIHVFPGIRDTRRPDHYGDVKITMLHPPYLHDASHTQDYPTKPNGRSLVLRLDYGEFRVLLLADIEGEGLEFLLDISTSSDPDELKCHIMKVPHHGGWNSREELMQTLLDRADPELAVLSVGSTNSYGHVVPRLFQELLQRKADPKTRLSRFICTEVTRTCTCSAAERVEMNKRGLSERLPCAGNIVIRAEQSGIWQHVGANEHLMYIKTLQYAACDERADLSPPSTTSP